MLHQVGKVVRLDSKVFTVLQSALYWAYWYNIRKIIIFLLHTYIVSKLLKTITFKQEL